MPNSDSAYVYRERGRVWIRMAIDEAGYDALRGALYDGEPDRGLYHLITDAEERRNDRSDIMDRFDDPDTETRQDGATFMRTEGKSPMDQVLLLSPEEAAQRLHLSRSRVYELMAAGQIESLKIGKARRIPVDALTDFVSRERQSQRQ